MALRVRLPVVRRLLDFQPTVVGRDGPWNLRELVRQGLDLVDVEAALREHGLESVKQMKLATLEADGSISIVAHDDGDARSHLAEDGAIGGDCGLQARSIYLPAGMSPAAAAPRAEPGRRSA